MCAVRFRAGLLVRKTILQSNLTVIIRWTSVFMYTIICCLLQNPRLHRLVHKSAIGLCFEADRIISIFLFYFLDINFELSSHTQFYFQIAWKLISKIC
jgi:hypothetical protein